MKGAADCPVSDASSQQLDCEAVLETALNKQSVLDKYNKHLHSATHPVFILLVEEFNVDSFS